MKFSIHIFKTKKPNISIISTLSLFNGGSLRHGVTGYAVTRKSRLEVGRLVPGRASKQGEKEKKKEKKKRRKEKREKNLKKKE